MKIVSVLIKLYSYIQRYQVIVKRFLCIIYTCMGSLFVLMLDCLESRCYKGWSDICMPWGNVSGPLPTLLQLLFIFCMWSWELFRSELPSGIDIVCVKLSLVSTLGRASFAPAKIQIVLTNTYEIALLNFKAMRSKEHLYASCWKFTGKGEEKIISVFLSVLKLRQVHCHV